MTSFNKVLASLITLLAQTPAREKVTIFLYSSVDSSNILESTSHQFTNSDSMLIHICIISSRSASKKPILFGLPWHLLVKYWDSDPQSIPPKLLSLTQSRSSKAKTNNQPQSSSSKHCQPFGSLCFSYAITTYGSTEYLRIYLDGRNKERHNQNSLWLL